MTCPRQRRLPDLSVPELLGEVGVAYADSPQMGRLDRDGAGLCLADDVGPVLLGSGERCATQ